MNSNPNDKARRAASQRRAHGGKAPSARVKYERYLALARVEDGNGDHVAAENYYQHAEHYFRASNGSGNDVSVKA